MNKSNQYKIQSYLVLEMAWKKRLFARLHRFYRKKLPAVRWLPFNPCTEGKSGRKFRDCFCLQIFQASWAKNFDLLRVIAVYGIVTIKFYVEFWVNGQKFSDWRMPTKFELNEIYLQSGAIGGFNMLSSYWSSTEENYYDVWYQFFGNGSNATFNKINDCEVRSVRSF